MNNLISILALIGFINLNASNFGSCQNIRCGGAKFDMSKSINGLTYSADRKTITRTGGSMWRGAYVEGYLHQSGTSELCIRATRYWGSMDGVMVGLASDEVPLDQWSNANQILIHLRDGSYRGGAADRSGVPDAGAANVNDVLKVVYDADANSLAFYRNGIAWGRKLQLNQKTIANKAKLRFFVSVFYNGQSATLM